ncbi:MAG TPA: DUF819 family protein [Tepidisphaeraceae bacterium]|jgi:uncharacterized membrane protein
MRSVFIAAVFAFILVFLPSAAQAASPASTSDASPPTHSLIAADNTWPLWSIILAGTALAIFLEQRFTWAAKISGPVIALVIAMTLSNLHVVPPESKVYDVVGDYLVPLAIPLLLFRANLLQIVRNTGPAFAAVQIAIIGSLIGSFAAAIIFKGHIANIAEVSGLEAASDIGGGVNFFAVKQIYGISGNLTGPLLVADNMVMAGAFLVLFWIADSTFFRKHFRHPHSMETDSDAARLAAKHWEPKPIGLLDIAKGLALAMAIAAASQLIAGYIKLKLNAGENHSRVILIEIGRSIIGSPYMWITALSVTVATIFAKPVARIQGANELGGYLLYLFLFCIGLPTDVLQVIMNVPLMFGLCIVINVVNIAVLLIVGYFCRMNLEDLLLASNATLGGPPTAAAMAISKGWDRLVLPGLLIGLWGYMTGTFFGIVVVEAVRRI